MVIFLMYLEYRFDRTLNESQLYLFLFLMKFFFLSKKLISIITQKQQKSFKSENINTIL